MINAGGMVLFCRPISQKTLCNKFMSSKTKHKRASAIPTATNPGLSERESDCPVRVICGGQKQSSARGAGRTNATASIAVAFINLDLSSKGRQRLGQNLLGVRNNKEIAYALITSVPEQQAKKAAAEIGDLIDRPVKILCGDVEPKRGSVYLVPKSHDVILEQGWLKLQICQDSPSALKSDQGINYEALNLELQHSLDKQAAQFSSMLEIAPDAIIATDSTMHITLFNRAAEKLFEYESSEIMGKKIETLMPDRFRAGHGKHVETFKKKSHSHLLMNERTEIYGRKKGGDEFPADASVGRTTVDGEDVFLIIARDITARKVLFDELLSAKEEAEFADLAKSEFLANMSHELRTPLNAVIGFSEAMTEEVLGPLQDHYLEYAKNIHQCGTHLNDLIEEILEHARVEAGITRMNPENILVDELFDWCMTITSKDAGGKQLDIKKNVSNVLAMTYADKTMARQIILNLLSNAIKFTPEKGEITLGSEEKEHEIVLWVKDSGIGIAKQDYRLVLTPFGQVKSSIIKTASGTGLGLPLARSLTEMNGGSLTFTSEVGVGSTFTVRLPKASATQSDTNLII